MIVITGAAGFIGSCLVAALNQAGYYDLVLVDDFSRPEKEDNYLQKRYSALVNRDQLMDWIDQEQASIQYIFHLGARTDTTEFDVSIHTRLNLEYSKALWLKCVAYGLPITYASSAATYGDGAFGFDDDIALLPNLKPLNPYGDSKHAFDIWALAQDQKPFQWAGLKFFNVYGPNEYHKGRMASVVYHAYKQIAQKGHMQLFRSHRPEYKDGEQLRDFVYVKDVIAVCMWLMNHRQVSGLFNLGSGQARTFLDLSEQVFKSLEKPADIRFVDTPLDIRETYQYFTEARMTKLLAAGYGGRWHSLEEGIDDYVSNYLTQDLYF
jgi:ADP-L-glycero-D-manno-heptose 6-epimerase